MLGYRNRLERDLERWQSRGWVTREGAEAIRADAATTGGGFGLAGALGILGAVLIGFAAMSFVAANWQSMSKLLRLAILFSALWASYGVAAALFLRNMPALAHAAVLTGIGLFGASIMLIAQMYHMEGNPPDAVLTWALGALLAGVVLRSNPALAAAMVLIVVWSLWERVITDAVHWPFLALWAAIATGYYYTGWRPGFHLAALALSGWLVMLGFTIWQENGQGHWLVLAAGALVAGGAAGAGPAIDRIVPVSKPLVAYGIAVAFSALVGLQFFERTAPLIWLAMLTLALLIAVVFWGWHSDNRPALWLGYACFSIEVLALYFKTLGTLLGTSLFFLIAGLIVIALSWIAYQLHRRRSASMEGAA